MMLLLLACASPEPGQSTFYADWDGDGFGDPWSDVDAATAPDGYVDNAEDCDDTRADVYPGAPEACDGVDQDCDGTVDDDATDAPTWTLDDDGDGFAGTTTVVACDAPEGATDTSADCDDGDATVYPGADDACADGVDADCDGADTCGRDRSFDLATWSLTGTTTGLRIGTTVRFARDGSGDAAVSGEPGHDNVGCETFVVAGAQSGALGPADAVADVSGACALLGFDDLDGDGTADLVARGDDGVYAWAGPIRGTLDITSAALLWDGDVDTGSVDAGGVWVAHPYDDDSALLFERDPTGATTRMLGTRDLYGDTVVAVVADQDLDGDGVPDVLALDDRYGYYDSYSPVVYTFLDGAEADPDGELDVTAVASVWWGTLALAAGDLDGDGLPELVVSYGGFVPGLPRSVYVLPGLGATTLDDALVVLTSAESDDVGAALALADTNGDGALDLCAGGPGLPDGWSQGGVDVVHGPFAAGTLAFADADEEWLAPEGTSAGDAIDAFDADGDGAADLLVGAPTADAYVMTGAAWRLPGGVE